MPPPKRTLTAAKASLIASSPPAFTSKHQEPSSRVSNNTTQQQISQKQLNVDPSRHRKPNKTRFAQIKEAASGSQSGSGLDPSKAHDIIAPMKKANLQLPELSNQPYFSSSREGLNANGSFASTLAAVASKVNKSSAPAATQTPHKDVSTHDRQDTSLGKANATPAFKSSRTAGPCGATKSPPPAKTTSSSKTFPAPAHNSSCSQTSRASRPEAGLQTPKINRDTSSVHVANAARTTSDRRTLDGRDNNIPKNSPRKSPSPTKHKRTSTAESDEAKRVGNMEHTKSIDAARMAEMMQMADELWEAKE